MQMTESEIVRSYRRADKKREQIKILAELNLCDKKTIREILRRNGEEVSEPGRTVHVPVLKPEPNKVELEDVELEPKDCLLYTPYIPVEVTELFQREVEELDNKIDAIQEAIDNLTVEISGLKSRKGEIVNWFCANGGQL